MYRLCRAERAASSLAAVLAVAIAATLPASSRADVSILYTARALQPGEVVVLTVTAPAGTEAVRVTAFNRDVPVWPIGEGQWRGLAGIDMEAKPGVYRAIARARRDRRSTRDGEAGDAADATATIDLTVVPVEFRTRRLKVNPDFVNPPATARPRIEADAKLLAHTWTMSARQRLWGEGFAAPVGEPANSAFGTLSIYNGETRSRHSGTDFLSPAGTRVRAPAAGRVLVAQDLYFTGNTVVVDHGLGLFSLFAHLSAIDASDGAAVAAGDVIGRVGATGRVTGPHLHWTVRLGGARVDPLSLIAAFRVLPVAHRSPSRTRPRRSFRRPPSTFLT